MNDLKEQNKIFLKIANDLKAQIIQSAFSDSYKLPSENDLATKYKVTRSTIRHALKVLENEDLIEKKRGSQSKVKLPFMQKAYSTIGSFSEYNKNKDIVTKVLLAKKEVLNNKECFHLKRLRGYKIHDKDVFLTIEDSYIDAPNIAGIENYDFSKLSLYKVLRQNYHIDPFSGIYEFKAINANQETANLLNVPIRTPLITVVQDVYSKDEIHVEHVTITYSNQTSLRFLGNINH